MPHEFRARSTRRRTQGSERRRAAGRGQRGDDAVRGRGQGYGVEDVKTIVYEERCRLWNEVGAELVSDAGVWESS